MQNALRRQRETKRIPSLEINSITAVKLTAREICENEYDKAFEVVVGRKHHTFDSFECAIHALAPVCPHCNCRIIGQALKPTDKSSAAFIARVEPGKRN